MPGVKSEYLFAARRALSLREYLLLDNQSPVHIMWNPMFVENIQRVNPEIVLKSNLDKLPVNEVANSEVFEKDTWFL